MNVVLSRLVFLAFLVMSGGIVYNALYLQDLRGVVAVAPPPSMPAPKMTSAPPADAAPQASASVAVNPPPVSTDLPPLEKGSGESSLVVRAVQRELAMRGFDVGEPDGRLSVKTRAAISIYESREGLPVTGVATDELLSHILLGADAKPIPAESTAADDAAKTPDDAATVKAVQSILADLGYAPGAIDGAIGSATSEAISAFQRDRNIAETGNITPEFLDELKRVTGRDLTKTAAKH